jgi:hypothetical protein
MSGRPHSDRRTPSDKLSDDGSKYHVGDDMLHRSTAALITGAVRPGVLAIVLLLPAAIAFAQTPNGAPPQASAPSPPTWSLRATAATYVFRDDDDYVQPTVAADRGALHLESRYNYEDRQSVSGFAGWNFEVGSTLNLELTPMLGGVVGETDGVIPALELTLSFRRFEFYSEGEYVFELNRSRDRFLYSWSEFSLWPTDWLRAGVVTQRTLLFHGPRDVQRGLLAGATVGRVEGVVYFFNPGSDDYYFVVSMGVSF